MDYVFDRCGFPYLTLPVLGLTVALLPLTRLQLGACLADAAGPAGELAALPDHAALLARNLRATPLPFGDADREGLFATELLPAEAAAVAAWLIPGGRLPSVAEWRVVCRSLQARTFSPPPAPPAGTARRHGPRLGLRRRRRGTAARSAVSALAPEEPAGGEPDARRRRGMGPRRRRLGRPRPPARVLSQQPLESAA
jgi:hypothetical protein